MEIEKALDSTHWKMCFGRDYELAVRQTTLWHVTLSEHQQISEVQDLLFFYIFIQPLEDKLGQKNF